jgi:predicted AAA+ superfamily ATPase
MIRSVILQQKEELRTLLGKNYQERQVPINHADYLASGLVKLITGPRRAGKSVFSLQLLKGRNFAYLNFDDDLLLQNFNEDQVIKYLAEIFPGYDYLLLDEIQNLDRWELWINKLYRRDFNLIITGSNAKLLSQELSTILTGRYLELELFPFSFAEVLAYNSFTLSDENDLLPSVRGSILNHLKDYLIFGGFPETIMTRDLVKNYLSGLLDSVLLKDVVRRFKVRTPKTLYDLAHYLLTNYCNAFSYNQLMNDLGLNSVATIKKFCQYLSETYLFFYLPRYSVKLKQLQKAPQKVYIADNGFVVARSFELSRNEGRLLENLVFIELLRRKYRPGLELFYYRTRNDKEVDFVCRQGHIITNLVQVCFDLSGGKTYKREISALIEAGMETNCTNFQVITWDQEEQVEEHGATINIIPAWKWLIKYGMND